MKNKLLENEKKITSGFIVPEDYFDNFSADLMQKLPAKEIKTISHFVVHVLIKACWGTVQIVVHYNLARQSL